MFCIPTSQCAKYHCISHFKSTQTFTIRASFELIKYYLNSWWFPQRYNKLNGFHVVLHVSIPICLYNCFFIRPSGFCSLFKVRHFMGALSWHPLNIWKQFLTLVGIKPMTTKSGAVCFNYSTKALTLQNITL